MSVNHNINRRQRLIWSSIRNSLNISLHERNIVNLIKIQETQDRLEKFLSFYTDGNKNEDLLPDLKFLNRYQVTPAMKDFLISIAECLNMTRNNCFELLENFFYINQKEYENISKLLHLNINFHDKTSQRYQNIITDLEDKKSRIIEFYFKERKNLILFFLDIFYKIFLEIENTPMDLLNLMDNLIKNKKLLEVFYKQLLNYGDNENNFNINNIINNIYENKIFNKNKFNNYYVKDIMYKIPIYLSEEQNLILELIMILINRQYCNDPKIFDELFKYFLKTKFYCYSLNISDDYKNIKDEIMIKSLIITLNSFQPEIINKILDGETNLINSLFCLKNFESLLKVYDEPLNNHIVYPIKLSISCIVKLIENNRNIINNSNNLLNKYEQQINREFSEKESFGILNIIDQKIEILEDQFNDETSLNIYDDYYNILYEWINVIMGLYYEEDFTRYDIQLYTLLFRTLSHFLPQKKFYSDLLNKEKGNNITSLFKALKLDEEKKNIFLNLCFSLSESIEPGEGNDNNEYLLNILFKEPIENLKSQLDECEDDFSKKQQIIFNLEMDIFFKNIIEVWETLNQELKKYSQIYQSQLNIPIQESLPEELSNPINYIRLFIRSVLPGDCFSNFIFNYTCYTNIKEKNNYHENSIVNDEENYNFNFQEYNPDIMKSFIIESATALNAITELKIPNKNILFGEFITELLKLFILYAKDAHFTECLKNCSYFFDKFTGRNIIYNIIANDHNTQDFTNTLYAIKFLKEMFKPDIFLVVARNSDYNSPNKFGELFYISNFYYIKETINHFTQVNEIITPINSLIIAELAETMTLIMNYLEFKGDYNKIDLIETQNSYYENRNLVNFVIKLLMQDNKDYSIEDNSNQTNNNSTLLLVEFIFKYIGIKINDEDRHNFDYNEDKRNISFNNTYVQLYMRKNNINKDNIISNFTNLSYYKKMILNVMNCFNKILSLIIIYQKNEDRQEKYKENIFEINKYNKIYFLNKLYLSLIENKEIPHYIYESIDEKRKYNFNIILLLFFYSLYEIENNEQLNIQRKHIINLDEEQPNDLEFFMIDLKDDTHLNVCTSALNSLSKIIYIIKDTGININNYFSLEEITSSELNINNNLFKNIRYKMIKILGSQNLNIDLLKIEILKFLIIATKYQQIFIRDFIQINDDFGHNTVLFSNLNQSLKINYNFSDFDLNNDNIDYDLKIDSKSLKAELFTYITIFISELLNEIQDMKITESLLIKDNGLLLINNLIHYGIHSCDILDNFNEFYKVLDENLSNSKNNISDILFLSNKFKLILDIFGLKLNIIRSLSIIFKRILLISKKTNNLSINFKYIKELKYFIQTTISDLIEFYSKSSEYDYIKVLKNMQFDLEANGIQLRQIYLTSNKNTNKENLEMIIENYIYRYDYNYSFDIKELILIGFYDKMFREKHLKNIVINNNFICYNSLMVQTLTQAAHLYGLVFSIGEYNYLLTNKLFVDNEIYQKFKNANKDPKIINIYTHEIKNLLKYDNCYNYKLNFNPFYDFIPEKNENNIINLIKFIKNNILEKCLKVQNIPNLTLDSHRLYYQMFNSSMDYIIYLHNKCAATQIQINIKIYLFDFLKKLISVLNEGIINQTINETNLLSLFNSIHHIVYYLVLTEENFDSPNINDYDDKVEDINNLINNEIEDNYNDNKIQIIIELMDAIIMTFKRMKISRSFLLYITSSIVLIKSDALRSPILELLNIIIKLYSKENDSFEFQSFLLLLTRLRINYPILLMDALKDPQIFNFIHMKCGYNLDIGLYENQERSSAHLIYCWTLKVFNGILDTYLTKINTELKPSYNVVISYCMKFTELIQQRFTALFNVCLNNENIVSHLNQNNYITLAYLDELKASIEFINSFISVECDNLCPNTKDQSFLEFLFESVDLIANTCLYLFKNGYQQIFSLCKPNSYLENLMLNSKIIKSNLRKNNDKFDINSINNMSNFTFANKVNIYRDLLNDNANSINNENNNLISEDKTANVFYFKIKSSLIMILFHISSCMTQLLNRQNFNIKQYFFNKYQLKENEMQLNTWPLLYLNSIKFAGDFLKDIIMNLEKYKLLYNKTLIISNSINISFANCFYNIIEPEYPLNELVDLILFILNDFCILTPHYKDFIELIIKNHPYINNNKSLLNELFHLTRKIDNEIKKYSTEFDEDDNFIDEYNELKKNIGDLFKSFNNIYSNSLNNEIKDRKKSISFI